jgi:hypothetical protein
MTMGERGVGFSLRMCAWTKPATLIMVLADAGLAYYGDEEVQDLYNEDEVPAGFARDLAASLQRTDPGALWEMREEPTGDSSDGPQVGELYMYTPELGLFGPAPCDGAGDVVFTFAQVVQVLEDNTDEAIDPELALYAAYGCPWKWALAELEGTVDGGSEG